MKLGSEAPDFTLMNTSNEEVNLNEVLKETNVVLLFFPLAFSSVCTKEMCTTRDNLKIYNALDAKIIGISVDSFFTLRAFKEANNLNFALLSDFNKEVSKSYDVLYDDFYGMKGVSKRALFLIDQNRTIQHKQVLDDADDMPDFNRLQEALSNL